MVAPLAVDDLQEVIQENLNSRQQAANQAEEIIDVQVARFMAWLRAQDAVSTIRDYRQRAERNRDQVLAKAQQLLANGRPPQQVLAFLMVQNDFVDPGNTFDSGNLGQVPID